MDLKNIKSWQIAAAGTALQFITGIFIFRLSPDFEGIAFALFPVIIGCIFVILYRHGKTQKLASLLGILLGIIALSIARLPLLHWSPNIAESILMVLLFFPAGLFALIAGIYYFWKKV